MGNYVRLEVCEGISLMEEGIRLGRMKTGFRIMLIGILFLLLPWICIPAHALSAGQPGHWSQERLQSWKAEGRPDIGPAEPDRPVRGEEFASLAARIWGMDILETFRSVVDTEDPEGFLTRREAVAYLYRALSMEVMEYGDVISPYKDADSLAPTDKRIWNTVVSEGVLAGYPDGTLKPERALTLAEAVVILDNAAGRCCSRASQEAAPDGLQVVEGNVTVRTAGIRLENMKITGNLYLTAEAGEGKVLLDTVTVLGRTLVMGRGTGLLALKDCALGKTILRAGHIRIEADAKTMIGEITAMVPAVIEKQEGSGVGIGNVRIQLQENTQKPVELIGSFGNIHIAGTGARVMIRKGKVDRLEAGDMAAGTVLSLQEVHLGKLYLQAASAVVLHSSRILQFHVEKALCGWSAELSKDSVIESLFSAAEGKVTGEGRVNKVFGE